MRPVILIGGPFDGMTTEVTNDIPVYWHIPVSRGLQPVVRPLPSAADDHYLTQRLEVATYMHRVIGGLGVVTKCEFYEFSSMH